MTDPSTPIYVTLALIGVMLLAIAVVWWSSKVNEKRVNERLQQQARDEEKRLKEIELLNKKGNLYRELSQGARQVREEIDMPRLRRAVHNSRNDNIVDSDFVFTSLMQDSTPLSSSSSWSSSSSGSDSSSSWSSSSFSCGGDGGGGGGGC